MRNGINVWDNKKEGEWNHKIKIKWKNEKNKWKKSVET